MNKVGDLKKKMVNLQERVSDGCIDSACLCNKWLICVNFKLSFPFTIFRMKDKHRSALMLYLVDAAMRGMIMTLPYDMYVRRKGNNRKMHSVVNAVLEHKEKIRYGANGS